MQRTKTPTEYVEVTLGNGAKIEWAPCPGGDVHLLWSIPGYESRVYEATDEQGAEQLVAFLNKFTDWDHAIDNTGPHQDLDTDFREKVQDIVMGAVTV